MAGVGTKSNGIAQPPKCAINGVHPRGSIRMGCLSQKIRGAHIALNAFDKNGPDHSVQMETPKRNAPTRTGEFVWLLKLPRI